MNLTHMIMRRATRWHFVVLSMAVFAVTAAPEAAAQSPFEPGTVTVTPSIGFALDPDADMSLAVSGAVAYPVSRLFVVEGELGHVFDLAPDDAIVDSSLTTVHGSLLFLIDTEYLLMPYLAAGLGIGRFSYEVAGPRASFHTTEVGVNLGGGLAYPIRDGVWLRGDLRYFNHIDAVPAVWRFTAGLVLKAGE